MLSQIRKAVEDCHHTKLPPLPDPPIIRNPKATFTRALEAVQGIVFEAPSVDYLIRTFQEILESTSANRICWESPALLDQYQISYQWHQTPLQDSPVCSSHEQNRFQTPLILSRQSCELESLSKIPVSVSEASWAIAETGSIFESTGPGKSRILPILTPVHVVILKESKILPTQNDFFQIPELGKTGSAQIIMTGPSRTADIEKVLALGVHGPKKLYVILV